MLCRRNVNRSVRSAFSLVEMIVVMVIIAMLAGIVTVTTRGYLISSRQSTAKAELATLAGALDGFYAENNRYPTNEEGLDALTRTELAGDSGVPPLKEVPLDPWKRAYEYNTDGSTYEVICLGADGREGGEGENKDLRAE